MEQKNARSFVAELVGTFLLVLFIGLVVSMFSQSPEALGVVDWTAIGLVHVLVLTMLVASLAGVSGAHFNPAVTIALAAMRKIRGADAGVYIVMQLIGGWLGAMVVKAVIKDEGDVAGYGATAINKGFVSGNFGGMVLELIGTFALMLAILGTAVIVKNKSDLAPLVIGGTLGMAVMCIGPLTGAGLNPARALGPLLVSGDFDFGDFIVVYAAGPIVGALLAVFLVGYLYGDEPQEAEAVTAPREDIIDVTSNEV